MLLIRSLVRGAAAAALAVTVIAAQPSSQAQPAPARAVGALHAGRSAATVAVLAGRTHKASHAWLSGASGDGVASGGFAKWRGRTVEISGTWNDNFESQEAEWSLMPQFSYGHWTRSLDDAVGAIYKNHGETWAKAARGAYDDRWRHALTNMRTLWADRPGTLYIRFAHEFNGDWEPWSVSRHEAPAFKLAWHRFRRLQRHVFPEAKLVFCPNADTSGSLNLDWRKAFPGRGQVDVIAVDYYNQWPFVGSARSFRSSMQLRDHWGAPRGLERHRRFAASQRKPFALSEWSSNADMGDSPAFMAGLHTWLRQHGGHGAGRVLYEIQFNIGSFHQFRLHPYTEQSRASGQYRRLW